MALRDVIEFYSKDGLVVAVDSSAPPPVDSVISIRGVPWVVTNVTYAIDHSDNPFERRMRVNVDISPC